MSARNGVDSQPGRGHTAVIAGLTLNGATVLRRVVQLGYDAYGVTWNADEQGLHVGGARFRVTPDPRRDSDGWVECLLEVAEDFDEPAALIPMSDVHVVALDREAHRLRGSYRFHGCGSGLRTSLTSKRRTFELAEEHDFPRPVSRWIENRDQLAAFWEELGGPVLIKPDLTYHWRTPQASSVVRSRKVMIGKDLDDLLRTYDEIAHLTPGLLAQEVIPGPDDQLIYWCGFVGPEGRVGARLTGRKRRIVPIHFGSATYVELVDKPEVEELCERFLVGMGYQGMCGVELKIDPRDGVAKLIEINPRYGLWDDIGIPVGVDIAGDAVASLFGAPTVAKRPEHFEQRWVELTRDLPAALEYRREGLLTMAAWFYSLRPPIVVNDLPMLSDPGYAAHIVGRRVKKLFTPLGLPRPDPQPSLYGQEAATPHP